MKRKLISGIGCLGFALLAIMAIAVPRAAYAYSINPANYPDDQKKLTNAYENNCSSNPRKYNVSQWVSAKGDPSNDTAIEVPYGTTDVNLQYNNTVMLCHDVTDFNPPRPIAGMPADGTPSDSAALSKTQTKGYSPFRATGGSLINTDGLVAGNTIYKDANSRYWDAAPTAFAYRSSGPIRSTRNIVVSFNTRSLNTFGSSSGSCVVPPGSPAVNTNNINDCPLTQVSIPIKIIVKSQGSIEAASCTNMSGWAFDPDSSSQSVLYKVYIANSQHGLTYAYTGAANKPRDDINRHFGISGKHGWDFNPSALAQFNPRVGNTVEVRVQDLQGGEVSLGSRSIGPCMSAICNGNTFSGAMIAGQEMNFTAGIQLNHPWGEPYTTTTPGFRVTILDPNNRPVTGWNDTPVNYSAGLPPGPNITSDNISFIPSESGEYTLKYRFGLPAGTGNGTTAEPGTGYAYCGADGTINAESGFAPYFRVDGGDVEAGAGLTSSGSCTANDDAGILGYNRSGDGGSYFGAGAQLAAFALGDGGNAIISQFASGTSGDGGSSGSGTQPSALAFSNIGAAGNTYGGQFGLTGSCLTFTTATPTASTGDIDLATLTSSKSYTIGSDIRLTASGPIAAGTNVKLVLTGNHTVTIMNDITYDYGTTVNDIPHVQIIVVGGNLAIDNDVQNVHASITVERASIAGGPVSGGKLETCQLETPVSHALNPTDSADVANCNKTLTFYGPVSVSNIRLSRTLGNLYTAAGSTTDPAERFVYSPESWLPGKVTGVGDIDAITSLPPVL